MTNKRISMWTHDAGAHWSAENTLKWAHTEEGVRLLLWFIQGQWQSHKMFHLLRKDIGLDFVAWKYWIKFKIKWCIFHYSSFPDSVNYISCIIIILHINTVDLWLKSEFFLFILYSFQWIKEFQLKIL